MVIMVRVVGVMIAVVGGDIFMVDDDGNDVGRSGDEGNYGHD